MSILGESFVSDYMEAGRRWGQLNPSHPSVDLRRWSNFVSACIEGYHDNLAEYNADLWTRTLIQAALDDAAVRSHPSFVAFEDRVKEIDRRFKKIATVEIPARGVRMASLSWWDLVLPASAGEEMARDVQCVYGIIISVV
ncbi:hypothetical protein ABZZ36_28915 [Actinacidiphila glaucinigra]|uniref:hypothetical protein n=1 Tax=Actinacidiphila glaucinigra TaxID=235986 RepID=UPI0033A797C9